METATQATIEHVVAAIQKTGYEPYKQIYGYLSTGNETYITRQGNARGHIKLIDKEQLQLYLNQSKMP